MPAVTAILAEIIAYGFWMLIAALVGGRLALLALKLRGEAEAARRWARTFDRHTAYLRP